MQTMAGECGAGGGGAQSMHSVPSVHIGNSEPGLPSSSALEVKHGFEQMLGGGLGAGCAAGGRGGSDGMETRGPQPTLLVQ